MQVKKLNWGLSHWINDDLQVELMPHAWLGNKRAKVIKINEILPLSLFNEYTYARGVLTHNSYLSQ
ncbi:hypothetical protein OAL60_00560 [bacterium]|nr:hypothetical protein [bacterium]